MIAHVFARVLSGVALVVLVGSAASPAPVADSENAVIIKNFEFSPAERTVSIGSSVTWRNEDAAPHTVTAGSAGLRSGALDTGDSFTFKFDKPGTYKYFCSLHPRMVGTIVVK